MYPFIIISREFLHPRTNLAGPSSLDATKKRNTVLPYPNIASCSNLTRFHAVHGTISLVRACCARVFVSVLNTVHSIHKNIISGFHILVFQ